MELLSDNALCPGPTPQAPKNVHLADVHNVTWHVGSLRYA
jgi:hypothetical protein